MSNEFLEHNRPTVLFDPLQRNPNSPFGISILEGPTWLDTYDYAEGYIGQFYPDLIDELNAETDMNPLQYHLGVCTRLPFLVVRFPSNLGGQTFVKLPRIACSIAGLDSLKAKVLQSKHNSPYSFKIFPSNNGLITDYLNHTKTHELSEKYHIGRRDPADYLVLSTLELFSNDLIQREFDFQLLQNTNP